MLLPPLPPVNFRNESHVEPIPFQGLVEIMVFLGFKNTGSYIAKVYVTLQNSTLISENSHWKNCKIEHVHFSRQMILALLAIIFYRVSFPDCASESGSKVAWRNSLLWQQQHFEFLNALRAGFYTSVSLLLKNQTNSSAAGKKRANFKVKAICLPRSLIINSLWSSRTTSGHFFFISN